MAIRITQNAVASDIQSDVQSIYAKMAEAQQQVSRRTPDHAPRATIPSAPARSSTSTRRSRDVRQFQTNVRDSIGVHGHRGRRARHRHGSAPDDPRARGAGRERHERPRRPAEHRHGDRAAQGGRARRHERAARRPVRLRGHVDGDAALPGPGQRLRRHQQRDEPARRARARACRSTSPANRCSASRPARPATRFDVIDQLDRRHARPGDDAASPRTSARSTARSIASLNVRTQLGAVSHAAGDDAGPARAAWRSVSSTARTEVADVDATEAYMDFTDPTDDVPGGARRGHADACRPRSSTSSAIEPSVPPTTRWTAQLAAHPETLVLESTRFGAHRGAERDPARVPAGHDRLPRAHRVRAAQAARGLGVHVAALDDRSRARLPGGAAVGVLLGVRGQARRRGPRGDRRRERLADLDHVRRQRRQRRAHAARSTCSRRSSSTTTTRLAKQVINTADGYSTRDPLFRAAEQPTPGRDARGRHASTSPCSRPPDTFAHAIRTTHRTTPPSHRDPAPPRHRPGAPSSGPASYRYATGGASPPSSARHLTPAPRVPRGVTPAGCAGPDRPAAGAGNRAGR